MILAGTNRVDNLDQALTRPGRFDRQIIVANDALEFENKSMRIPFLCTVDQIKKLESLLKVESAFCC